MEEEEVIKPVAAVVAVVINDLLLNSITDRRLRRMAAVVAVVVVVRRMVDRMGLRRLQWVAAKLWWNNNRSSGMETMVVAVAAVGWAPVGVFVSRSTITPVLRLRNHDNRKFAVGWLNIFEIFLLYKITIFII